MPEVEIPEAFLWKAEDLRLKALNDCGDYVHLKFMSPDAWSDGFEINAWPGFLCWVRGGQEYLFRVAEPLEFFSGKPNPAYWAEKCVAHGRRGVTEYKKELFDRAVSEAMDEAGSNKRQREAFEDGHFDLYDDVDARLNAVRGFGLEVSREVVFGPTDEFLLCCYSLSWGLARFKKVEERDARFWEHLSWVHDLTCCDEPPISTKVRDDAVTVAQTIDKASGRRMPVPAACTGPDGQMFYQWDLGRHHLSVDIVPEGPIELFYCDRETEETWYEEWALLWPIELPSVFLEKMSFFYGPKL